MTSAIQGSVSRYGISAASDFGSSGADYSSNTAAPANTEEAEDVAALPAVCSESSAWAGDSMESRMAVMVLNHATEARRNADEQRDVQEGQISKYEQEEIHQIHRSADLYRKQATEDLVLGISSAALETGGALCGSDSTAGALAKGGAKTLTAVQGYADRMFQGRQGDIKGAETQAGNSADAAKRRLEDINESKKAANDLESRAINFYTTAAQLNADGERAAIFKG